MPSKVSSKAKPKQKSKGFDLSSERNLKLLAVFVFIASVVIFASHAPERGVPCTNKCGDGVCQDVVCEAIGCPCLETPESCPKDCQSGFVMSESEIRQMADDYVRRLYCFNNYNSSNLVLKGFEKVSDEHSGIYEVTYQFDVDTPLLPDNIKLFDVDLIISDNVVVSANVTQHEKSAATTEDFCGYSTGDPCETDSDCITGGCSGQVCQSKSRGGMVTDCEWRDCYDASKYNKSCKCIGNKCAWS
ncbi:MAG: eight-cysteine-cluster domain-containing protein [Candidatus Aenigmarchaeota archaeon]|nr:eight-cysteine-cluster domain-containing protein [Candidatus Aenigmarchaeota archaeon]